MIARRSMLHVLGTALEAGSTITSTFLSTSGLRFTAKLAGKEYTSKHGQERRIQRTAVIAHGLLGQGKNWRTFARRLVDDATQKSACPDTRWRVLTVDLRCHGDSTGGGASPPHDMAACAADIVRWVRSDVGGKGPEIICGHSLGGKVILDYCRQTGQADSPLRPPHHAWVLDSQPGPVAKDMVPDVGRVLQAVKGMPAPIKSRKELYTQMKGQGFSEALVQWMGSNLVDIPGDAERQLEWAFDVVGAIEMYRHYREADYLPMLSAPPKGQTLNVVRAGASDRWNKRMIQELDDAASASKVADKGTTVHHVLEGAGHWVHMDRPEELREMILTSMYDVTSKAHDTS